MAASIKNLTRTGFFFKNSYNTCNKIGTPAMNTRAIYIFNTYRSFVGGKAKGFCYRNIFRSAHLAAKIGFVTTIGVGIYVANISNRLKAFALQKPEHKPLRSIKNETDSSGLKLTIYQYQTCPFCTKVRAYLDYMGISYDVVEVNSVWRKEMKWSRYKKVPVLLVDGVGEQGFLQLNDSSVIISILESFLEEQEVSKEDRSQLFEKFVSYYPQMEVKNDRGKTVFEFPTKYNVVYGQSDGSNSSKTLKEQKRELKWRKWNDDWLVHTLSPNIYRTPGEALQSFRYFDEVGQWQQVFSAVERTVVIYLGACAMWLIGKKLKKKYDLQDDVRLSLYDACDTWTKAVARHGQFMGGDKPNLADLAVYGSLNAIEGCEAFQDAVKNTDIGLWYYATKQAVMTHAGARPVSAKR